MGDVVPLLPWLPAAANSLVALARSPAAKAWREIRYDPGAVLLAFRHVSLPAGCLHPVLEDAAILETALRLITEPGIGIVDWNHPPLDAVYRSAVAHARIAGHLAMRNGVDSERAWAAGMLTHLGWMAMAVADEERTLACLNDPELQTDPMGTQRRHWGIDQADIARRLARRWNLPRWLTLAIGHLDLQADHAEILGAEVPLFRVVQWTATLARRHGHAFGVLSPGEQPPDLDALDAEIRGLLAAPDPTMIWQDPAATPLLEDLLCLAARNRRLQRDVTLDRFEDDITDLHDALLGQRAREDSRLRDMKLRSLAEFAAGAGHEINNPLAVISGQAQYLLQREPDPSRQQALNKIIQQAQRIHTMLTELMQFAKPSPPKPQPVSIEDLLHEVVNGLVHWAEQRHVGLRFAVPETPTTVLADPKQLKMALTCLLRNAIEAAQEHGWASLRVARDQTQHVEFIVEDSGEGVPIHQRENLFDPFYSGRQAGRGRGLGLPTAWQLARVNGGDLKYMENDAPTRFVLRLPTAPAVREESDPILGDGCNGRPHRIPQSGPQSCV